MCFCFRLFRSNLQAGGKLDIDVYGVNLKLMAYLWKTELVNKIGMYGSSGKFSHRKLEIAIRNGLVKIFIIAFVCNCLIVCAV